MPRLSPDSLRGLRVRLEGRVQGVGFRPFVYHLALKHQFSGWILNDGGSVEIHIESDHVDPAPFLDALILEAPPLARPRISWVRPTPSEGAEGFRILDSRQQQVTDQVIPPDQVVCRTCLLELEDPNDRRYRYPFIHCTQCGPRYTVIRDFPYDRSNTVMADFPLCERCQSEYENPRDRRYHAEIMACAVCGPVLSYRKDSMASPLWGESALQAAIDSLRAGQIVAVKGMGGYHLMLDATRRESIERLRNRKKRPGKPLAVLVSEALLEAYWPDDGTADRTAAREALAAPERPIVMMPMTDPSSFPEEIAPGLLDIGVMLPSTPLQILLLEGVGRPLVATSGNLSGEPILTDPLTVEQRLGHVADGFLHHNRAILRPADDGVSRVIAGKARPIRIGRGVAPLEWRLSRPGEVPILAVGADLKNTFALAWDDRLVVSPHLGDLGSPYGFELFERQVATFQKLYRVEPQRVVVDAHPGYFSRQWALSSGLPVISVGHHAAHASAVYEEWDGEGPLLVFAFDGFGYGCDGTLWGGETLLGVPGKWRRVGCPRAFSLVGGARSAREPWRSALALCFEVGHAGFKGKDPQGLLRTAWQQGINTQETTSVGRLFDAAAALLGLRSTTSYEGEAAMVLEALVDPTLGLEGLPLPIQETEGLHRWDWSPLLDPLMDQARSPVERATLFHETLARLIADLALLLKGVYGEIPTVGLSGGVFQNRWLTESAVVQLERRGFEVFLPSILPVNDAAISVGQVIEARAQMNQACERRL